MANEFKIDGSSNIVIQDVKDSTVNVTQILGKSHEYGRLLHDLSNLEKLFGFVPESDTSERLRISGEIDQLREFIEQFKRDVLQLARAFQDIEINTDRLRRAKEFFDKGEFGEARAVLEIELEQMQDEQLYLLEKRKIFEKDTLRKLISNSEEFLILALTTQTDYENPDRFEDSCEYFRNSIESCPSEMNIFQFATFLHDHKQFKNAEFYYLDYLDKFRHQLSIADEANAFNRLAALYRNTNQFDKALTESLKALEIFDRLVEIDSAKYLPSLATSLSNLSGLYMDEGRYFEAEQGFERVLTIRRSLAESSPETYLSDLAAVLINFASLNMVSNRYAKAMEQIGEALRILRSIGGDTVNEDYLHSMGVALGAQGSLHRDLNNYDDAIRSYEEALDIEHYLVQIRPHAYIVDLARTLHNFANLYFRMHSYSDALEKFTEALEIKRHLASLSPEIYLWDVAMTLNNIAAIHEKETRYDEALKEYEEALEIFDQLASANPDVFLKDVAMTFNNISILYKAMEKYEDASNSIGKALHIYSYLAETNSETYLPHLALSLRNIGNLHSLTKKNHEASKEFDRALEIYRHLTIVSPDAYMRNLLETLILIAIYYRDSAKDPEKSINAAIEAIAILSLENTKGIDAELFMEVAMGVVADWELTPQEMSGMVIEKREEIERQRFFIRAKQDN